MRENRLRRLAARRGLKLEKSRRRDPDSIGYGGYMLLHGNNVLVGATQHEYQASLDDIEDALSRGLSWKGWPDREQWRQHFLVWAYEKGIRSTKTRELTSGMEPKFSDFREWMLAKNPSLRGRLSVDDSESDLKDWFAEDFRS